MFQEEADDDLLCADQCPSWSLDWPQIYRPHVKRGTKGKLVFCNCYHQKVNVEPSHYIIWFEKVKKNTLPILYQYQKSWYWYNFTENLHLILSKNKWIFTGNFQKLFSSSFFASFPKGNLQKKNREKAVRLTPWVDPPLPRSGQENVKITRQVVIFGVILPFYKGKI